MPKLRRLSGREVRHILERQGFVSSAWKTTEHKRRARYYALTAAGRKALAAERAKWERQSDAVNLVLRMTQA